MVEINYLTAKESVAVLAPETNYFTNGNAMGNYPLDLSYLLDHIESIAISGRWYDNPNAFDNAPVQTGWHALTEEDIQVFKTNFISDKLSVNNYTLANLILKYLYSGTNRPSGYNYISGIYININGFFSSNNFSVESVNYSCRTLSRRDTDDYSSPICILNQNFVSKYILETNQEYLTGVYLVSNGRYKAITDMPDTTITQISIDIPGVIDVNGHLWTEEDQRYYPTGGYIKFLNSTSNIANNLCESTLGIHYNNFNSYDDELVTRFIAKTMNPNVIFCQEGYEESTWLSFFTKLRSNRDEYIDLIKEQEKLIDKLTDDLESSTTSTTRFNDTPQSDDNYGADKYTSNISTNTSTSKVSVGNVADKLAIAKTALQDIYDTWLSEFESFLIY